MRREGNEPPSPQEGESDNEERQVVENTEFSVDQSVNLFDDWEEEYNVDRSGLPLPFLRTQATTRGASKRDCQLRCNEAIAEGTSDQVCMVSNVEEKGSFVKMSGFDRKVLGTFAEVSMIQKSRALLERHVHLKLRKRDTLAEIQSH